MGNEKTANRIIILVGRSGAGKDTVANALSHKYPELKRAISTTSRPMRSGEEDGVDYYFISKEEFTRKRLWGEFWDEVVYYAYKEDKLEDWHYGLEKDKNNLLEENFIIACDLPRLRQLKAALGDRVVSIYIDAPVDQRRVRAMAREKKFNIVEWERRVSDENYVFQNIEKEVDYIVKNDILEECLKQVENIYKWHA